MGFTRMVLRLNQMVQTIIAKSSTLHPVWRTCDRSCWKFPKLVCPLKFHCGLPSHTCERFGQYHRAWRTSSLWSWHWVNLDSLITHLRTRFVFVRNAFRQDLQMKLRTLHSTDRFQIFFQAVIEGSSDCWLGVADVRTSCFKKKYPDFAEYLPDWTKGQNRASFAGVLLSWICLISSHSSWLKAEDINVDFHWQVIGLMSELTLASCISAVRGPCIRGWLREGSQLSPYTFIGSPFPTLHLAPLRMTSLPCSMLFHA